MDNTAKCPLGRASTRVVSAVVSALVLGFACGSELPQARVAGTALAADTLLPLADVSVTWSGETITTDSSGAYAFTMPLGVQRLHVSRAAVSFATLIVIASAKDKEGLDQRQDVLVPVEAGNLPTWTASFLAAEFKDVAPNSVGAGILSTDAHGNRGKFLPLSGGHAQLAQWSVSGQVLYFADIEAHGRVFRYDRRTAHVKALECATSNRDEGTGFEPSPIEMLCVSPDGDTALVSTGKQKLVLRGMNGTCSAHGIGGALVPSTPARCSFDEHGNAFVSARTRDTTHGQLRGQLQVIQTHGADLSPRVVDWVRDWNINYPRVMPDGQLLLERTQQQVASHSLESWLLDLAQHTAVKISDTPAPVYLAERRLYYMAKERALRVRLLESGAEATLVNGAVFAAPGPSLETRQ